MNLGNLLKELDGCRDLFKDGGLIKDEDLIKAGFNPAIKEYNLSYNGSAINKKMQVIADQVREKEKEIARKAGYVQGVCECVAAIGDDHALGKKLLTEMNVTKDMAKKFANPETFKALEQGIFAPKAEQTLEQTQSFRR